jgi:hypothetical protein
MFTAAVTSAREPTAKMSLAPIAGCPELIKFEFKFTEESEARRSPFMSALIDGVDKPDTKHDNNFSAHEGLAPEQIAKQRAKTLKQCFPVTLHRIRVTPALQDLKSTLTAQGIRDWQVDQAICNLQISQLCHKYLLTEADRKDVDAPLPPRTGKALKRSSSGRSMRGLPYSTLNFANRVTPFRGPSLRDRIPTETHCFFNIYAAILGSVLAIACKGWTPRS